MTAGWVHVEAERPVVKKHRCSPPEVPADRKLWGRWVRVAVATNPPGSVWECVCGRQWMVRPDGLWRRKWRRVSAGEVS